MALGPQKQVGTFRVQVGPTAAHAGSASTEKKVLWVPEANVKVTGIAIVPDGATTGADTNTTHLNILDGGQAGAGTTEVANMDLTNGVDLTTLDGNAFTVTAFNLDADDVLLVQFEKVGTGGSVDIAAAQWIIDYRYR